MINKFFSEIKGNFGFGCMRLPMQGGKVDMPQFKRMVDSYIDSGFNYFHNWNQDYYYSNILTRENGKASDCIGCKQCERICPQHLKSTSLLKDVAREFER